MGTSRPEEGYICGGLPTTPRASRRLAVHLNVTPAKAPQTALSGAKFGAAILEAAPVVKRPRADVVLRTPERFHLAEVATPWAPRKPTSARDRRKPELPELSACLFPEYRQVRRTLRTPPPPPPL